MADSSYQTSNLILRSKGVMARFAVDAPPGESFFLQEENLEEIQENAVATRLGTTILSKSGSTALPLGGTAGVVHSLSKLNGLSSAWRYAGQGTNLYRIQGLNPGAYGLIYSAMSGQPWTSAQYQPEVSAYPYNFIADAAVMLKDNGSLTASENTTSPTSTGTSIGGGVAWVNPGNIDSNSSFATCTLTGAAGGTYNPSSPSGNSTSIGAGNQLTTLGVFPSVAATSATLYVTVNGSIVNTPPGNADVSLVYSVDGGVNFTGVRIWTNTFSSVTIPVPISGFTNLDQVYIQLQALSPSTFPGAESSITVTNWYAVTSGGGGTTSQTLNALISGLSVPSNATILGLGISFTGEYSGSVPGLSVLLSVGTEVATYTLTTSPVTYTGGGASDLWEYTLWSPATLINLSVQFTASCALASVISLNNLVVTVYYALPAAVQNIGIFQNRYPVLAQAQEPDEIILDPYTGSTYGTTNVGSFTPDTSVLATTTAAAITATGIQAVPVAATPNPILLFQSLVIDTAGNAETVLVLQVTPTGFIANFTKTHLTGVAVVQQGATGTVAASTTATVSMNFSGTPISAWPTTLEQEDYIGLQLYIGDPNAIQSITLRFNTANGAYFYRTIGQGPLQATLNPATDSGTAAADAVISDSLGLYTAGAGGVTGLSTVPGWTPILLQLSDFSGAGGADFNDPVMNWSNVNGYQITIVTGAGIASTSFPITFKLGSMILFGGAGPDSFAGVSYDYMVTLFNINDYTESNPTMEMTDVNPPELTNRVVPRRQPVLLNWTNSNVDTQPTHWRVYRRGGTLGDNFRRIDQIAITAATGSVQSYTDIWSDLQIQEADTISFTNDVPVTSPLPIPLNNLIGTAINTTNQVATVVFSAPYNTAASGFSQSVFVGQQVLLGNVIAANFETVIVLSLTMSGAIITGFTAFVQNTHVVGEPLSATAKYGQPLDIIAVAFDQGWYAGDPNNPSNLYWTPKGQIQYVSSAAYEPVNNSGDPITAIVGTAGNLFVSTVQRWWSISPGTSANSSPTIYPTQIDHGCVGKRAWTLRDGTVFYLALDGIRTMRGGGGEYISEIIEFVWQNTGPTPIPIADPAQFASVQASWWQRWIFFSYQALDGNRYRVILDVENKRYRTDNLYAESMFLEEDTATLLFGDNQGLVHLDRQLIPYDEKNVGGTVIQLPIASTLQTPYGDQGHPELQKQYQEFTLDAALNGNSVNCELLFNDGEFSEVIGTISTTVRQRVNLVLNNGAGYQAYKVSLLLTGSSTAFTGAINLFQAKLKYLPLAMTRQSLDTYVLRFGIDSSKICKQCYIEYNAAAPITGQVFYDNNPVAGFTFTLPQYSGIRNSVRVRFPAVLFRGIRLILTSTADFQVWEESRFEWKDVCQGKGYQFHPLFT